MVNTKIWSAEAKVLDQGHTGNGRGEDLKPDRETSESST